MTIDLSGRFFIDGIDLWTTFSMFIEKGSADFLRYPAKKESITHDWKDANGIDVDVSKYFFKERTGALNCAIVADNEDDYWTKQKAFIAMLMQPGLRRLQLKSHGQRSYYVMYQDCTSYTQVKPLKGEDAVIFGPNMVAAKFTIVVVEPEPQIDSSDVFLVDQDGNFIIA